MTRERANETARELLEIMPLVMRTVFAGLRAAGELPAPAHFPLLMTLAEEARTLTELAELRGVSLPTMSNSITALVQRGWARRVVPESLSTQAPAERDRSRRPGTPAAGRRNDRRVVLVEVTAAGRAALDRVARAAEQHVAAVLTPLDLAAVRQLHAGFEVLRRAFAVPPAAAERPRRRARARD